MKYLKSIFFFNETKNIDQIKKIVNDIIYLIENEYDSSWVDFVDNQKIGDCQYIAETIYNFKIPGVKKHFGEITINVPTNKKYYGKKMTHHWISYNDIPLEFSKGTLIDYVAWKDVYDPYDTNEIEYGEIKIKKECHFPELYDLKSKQLQIKYLDRLIHKFGSKENAINNFNRFYKIIFDLNNGGYIYRILTKLKKFYDYNNGSYWFHDKNKINIEYNNELYLITVKTQPNNIDIEETIKKFCENPFKEEIIIKDKSKLEIINVEKY